MIVKESKQITSMPSSQTGDATYCRRERSRLRSYDLIVTVIKQCKLLYCVILCVGNGSVYENLIHYHDITKDEPQKKDLHHYITFT